MPKLTDLQMVVLSSAAQRDDGALLPLPKRVKLEPRVQTRVFNALLKKALVSEQPAPPDAPAWRETGDGLRFMLVIDPVGLEAIGVEPEEERQELERSEKAKPSPKRNKKNKESEKATSPGVRPGTKLALMIELLGRDGGATIAEIVAATGWQQHSVRGAISGTLKKKHGLTVTSATDDGRGRVYRIARAG
jgi:Protein of unknown function (DUF3489)